MHFIKNPDIIDAFYKKSRHYAGKRSAAAARPGGQNPSTKEALVHAPVALASPQPGFLTHVAASAACCSCGGGFQTHGEAVLGAMDFDPSLTVDQALARMV